MAVYEFNGSKARVRLLDQDGNPSDLKGALKKITLPEVTKELDTDPRIGEAGQVTRTLGVSAMESTMELAGVSVPFLSACQRAFNEDREISVQVTMPGKDRYTSSPSAKIVTMRGLVTKLPSPKEVNPQEYTEFELVLGVNFYSDRLDGAGSTAWEFDASQSA